MKLERQNTEPFFITEDVEAELVAAEYSSNYLFTSEFKQRVIEALRPTGANVRYVVM